MNEVTVITPCAPAHAPRLAAAVQSCRDADPRPEAIIVTLDGPVDEPDILRHLAGDWLRVIRFEEPVERCVARNVAAARARTPWLYFLDADDTVFPYAFAKFREIMAAEPSVDLVYSDYISIRNGREKRIRRPVYRDGDPLDVNYTTIGMFVRRDRFLGVGGFDEAMPFGEYWDFTVRYILAGPCVVRKAAPPLFTAGWITSVDPEAEPKLRAGFDTIIAQVRSGYYSPAPREGLP